MKYCKYKVITQEHFESFDSEQMAKRAYGIIRKKIQNNATNLKYVQLYIKPTQDSEWQILQDCYIETVDGKEYINQTFDLKLM